MASRAVGEVINGQMEVLSVGQSLDKRSGQTMLKTRVRFTSGPFKGIETLVKYPANDGKKPATGGSSKGSSKSTAKSTASKPASKGAAKSTSKAAKSTSKGAAKKSTGKAKQVKPADTTKAQDTEDDLEELDLDFEDDEE